MIDGQYKDPHQSLHEIPLLLTQSYENECSVSLAGLQPNSLIITTTTTITTTIIR